jgi:hypothetical protein
MKQPVDDKCTVCYKTEEQMKHIVAGCTKLAPCDYTNRLNKVAGYIHWMICKHMGLQVTYKYYEQIPEVAIHFKSTIVMCDVPVLIGRVIIANWPDIVLHDKKENTCLLTDIAIPDGSYLNTKETEKLRKCKGLKINVSRMWKVGKKIVPLITGA